MRAVKHRSAVEQRGRLSVHSVTALRFNGDIILKRLSFLRVESIIYLLPKEIRNFSIPGSVTQWKLSTENRSRPISGDACSILLTDSQPEVW